MNTAVKIKSCTRASASAKIAYNEERTKNQKKEILVLEKNEMPPLQTLSTEDKKANQEKASKRIVVEHINAKIKTFQMLKQDYRNRRKRFNLRVNLICGLINFDAGFGV